MTAKRLILIWMLIGLLPSHAAQDAKPIPPYPEWARASNEEGKIVLFIKIGPTGNIASCQIITSALSKRFSDFACDYVKKNWCLPDEAGRSGKVPIQFSLDHSGDALGRSTLTPPRYPDVALAYNLQGDVDLAVTFDGKGEVEKCEITRSAAHPLLVNYTKRWVNGDWRDAQFAGKKIVATVSYSVDGSIGWSKLHDVRVVNP